MSSFGFTFSGFIGFMVIEDTQAFRIYFFMSEIGFNKLFFCKVGKFVEAFFVGFDGFSVVLIDLVNFFAEKNFPIL